jgi:hypothetical protein
MKLNGQMDSVGTSKNIVCLIMLTAILYLTCSCASDIANRYYGKKTYPPKQVNEVQMLRDSPSRPYDVIADFQSRGETSEDMRVKAAEIGADAVIISTLGGYRARGEQWAGKDSYGDTYSRITGTAIKYRD